MSERIARHLEATLRTSFIGACRGQIDPLPDRSAKATECGSAVQATRRLSEFINYDYSLASAAARSRPQFPAPRPR